MSAARSGPRAWFRTYAIALLLALTLTAAGITGLNVVIDRKLADIERIPNLDLDANTDSGEPANFLLIGSDTRAFVETSEEEESFGDPTVETGQRSDTLMVVHVDPENRQGVLVSFPRDLVVNVPGQGEQKINAAYNVGGAQLVIDTLKLNFDIPIHHYLQVDFASFKDIVDAVGGVPIHFDAPARDEETGLDVSFFGATYPGCFELDGQQALAFVRSREYQENIDGEWEKDQSADLGRIGRQQDFMRRMAAEAVAKSLSNPLAANGIANEALAELQVDEFLTKRDIFKLIQAFRRVDPNDPNSIETHTVPSDNDPSYGDLGDVQLLDEVLAEPIFVRLRELTPPPTAADDPAPNSIRVRVLNGSGVSGAAANAEAALGEHGFKSRGTGNSPDVAETEIRYRPGSEHKAEVLRSFLTGGVGELIADDTIVEADVTLVLGEDFQGVIAPGGAVPEGTVAPAPPPSSVTPPTAGPNEENTGPEQTDCG
jgi:LCP family protein required for cell wall assembly